MSNRTVFRVVITARSASTTYDGKTIKAADVHALDKALDELGAPRPRTFDRRDHEAPIPEGL